MHVCMHTTGSVQSGRRRHLAANFSLFLLVSFISFCIRTMAHVLSLFIFYHHHLHRFFSLLSTISCLLLSIHLAHVIFSISIAWIQWIEHCAAALQGNFICLRPVNRQRFDEMSVHVTWTALRHALLLRKQPKHLAIARQISIFYSILLLLLILFLFYVCVWEFANISALVRTCYSPVITNHTQTQNTR